ncbi:MAG: YdbH family protein, partial [Kluyvera sp.]
MKGKYKAALALFLLLVLLPLTLVMTLGYWVPTLVGIWLPAGTRIALNESPRLTRSALHIPDLRYLVGDCELARLQNVTLSHPSHWQLHAASVNLNSVCFNKLPSNDAVPGAPRTLAQWQSMLPNTWLTIDSLSVSPWEKWQGKLNVSLSPQRQSLEYEGEQVSLHARLQGQSLTVSEFKAGLIEGEAPIQLVGEFTMPLVPDGLPIKGHLTSSFQVPQVPSLVDAELEWDGNQGQLLMLARGEDDPLIDLPWQLTEQQLTISDGRWSWPYQAGLPLSGRVGLKLENWQQGLDNTRISGRLNVLTAGDAGKGNAVLTLGPGTLSMDNSEMPLQLTGEAKQGDLIFYARLPAHLSGPLATPILAFQPSALLRSRGRLIDALNIDDVSWPLAGVTLSTQGIDGRLQAILRAHEQQTGDFILHLDGKADNFMPDKGTWQWRYWGDGHFTPMNARWDVAGTGEWRDSAIVLNTLSTGFDKLQYGTMTIDKPRLTLKQPIHWIRDEQHPSFSGSLALDANETRFTGGSVLPASALTFSVQGRDPTFFQFKGDLKAQAIGPIR